jgi:UDP-N-acetylglucosamine 2-epimerase (non-hydrolysing)
MKVFLVAGARPNFMKIAPVFRAAKKHPGVDCRIVHTGQHYDQEMSQAFFDDLDLPLPDFHLDAGSGTHAVQTAKIMTAFEKTCMEEKPDWVVVVGDVNSTLACSIVAKKMLTRVAHVEAGLRSFDMTMPEELNPMVTDSTWAGTRAISPILPRASVSMFGEMSLQGSSTISLTVLKVRPRRTWQVSRKG